MHGTVGTASNPNGAYTGVAVNDAVELSCEVFLTSPPPVIVAPGQFVQYAVDLPTLSMTFGAIGVVGSAGSPTVGMINNFPASDGVQGPNATLASKALMYSINH